MQFGTRPPMGLLVFWICSVLKTPNLRNWNICALICARKRCNIFTTLTFLNLALNLAGIYNLLIKMIIFKNSCLYRDEGVCCEVEVDYVDNVPCIDLISSLRTGLLSMLDVECSIRGTAESYVAKIKV